MSANIELFTLGGTPVVLTEQGQARCVQSGIHRATLFISHCVVGKTTVSRDPCSF